MKRRPLTFRPGVAADLHLYRSSWCCSIHTGTSILHPASGKVDDVVQLQPQQVGQGCSVGVCLVYSDSCQEAEEPVQFRELHCRPEPLHFCVLVSGDLVADVVGQGVGASRNRR